MTRFTDTGPPDFDLLNGFADAFNPQNGWVNPDVIGIDLGISLVSTENLRSGKVWFWFMQNDEIRRALKMVSLEKST